MSKVVICVNNAWQAYNFRMNLARGIKRSGYEVIFVAPKDDKYSNLIREEFECIDVYMNPKGINPKEDFKTILHLKKIYQEIKPDIVLSFTIKPNIYSSLVTGMLGIKSITNITGLGTIFLNQSLVTTIAKMMYKVALKQNYKIFFQNRDDYQLFLEKRLIKDANCDILPGSGVDTDRFRPIERKKDGEKFVFLLIARMLWDKGVGDFVEAGRIIKQNYENVEFHLLGFLNVENSSAITKEQMQNWVDEGIVTYLGVSDNVQEEIAKVDAVVLPSYYREGTPRVLLESASMAKPLITTNNVGCKDVVDDRYNGYICEIKNPQELSQKMEMMINLSKEELKIMGNNGRDKMLKEFDEKIVINKYIENIKKALGK